jgi:putative FmdB family regulatory protein
MPIYEYRCLDGHLTEKLSFSNTEKSVTCPICGQVAQRIISVPGKCVIKMGIHTDSGLPQDYIDHAKIPEEFERNLARQGKQIDPEDM